MGLHTEFFKLFIIKLCFFFFYKNAAGREEGRDIIGFYFLNDKMPLDIFSSLTLTMHLSLCVSHRDISLKMPKYFQKVLNQVPFGGV